MARRRKVWIPFLSSQSVAGSAEGSQNLLSNLPLDIGSTGGLTVVRIEGLLRYHCATISTFQNFGVAITVHDENITASAYADFLTEPKAHIMWSLFTRANTVFVESAAGTFDPIDAVVPVSIRTMRKIGANEILRLYVQNSVGQTIVVTFGGRVLIALP